MVNVAALKQMISDYKDSILSDIYIGRHEGFLEDIRGDLETMKKELEGNKVKVIRLSSPKQAIEEFVKVIDKHIE